MVLPLTEPSTCYFPFHAMEMEGMDGIQGKRNSQKKVKEMEMQMSSSNDFIQIIINSPDIYSLIPTCQLMETKKSKEN